MDKSVDSRWEPTAHLRWVNGVLHQRFERRLNMTPAQALRALGPYHAVEWETEEEWREVESIGSTPWAPRRWKDE